MSKQHILLALSTATLTLAGCTADLPADEPATGDTGEAADETTGEPDEDLDLSTSTGTTDGERPDLPGLVDPADCEPGATEVCTYGGPAAALSVGTCTAAVRTCDDRGEWGPCTGEVLPQAEDCRTQRDENCDGRVVCDGEIEWLHSLGERPGGLPGPAGVYAMTVDPAGHAWFTGWYHQSLVLGEHTRDVGDGVGLFVAEVDPRGQPRFDHADEGAGAFAQGVALASDGPRIAIGADNQRKLAIHPDAPVYETPDDTMAAAIGVMTTTGEYAWSRALTPTGKGRVSLTSLAFASTGDLWAAGYAKDTDVTTAGGPLLMTHGGHDGLLVKLGPTGDVAYAGSFGDERAQYIRDIAVDDTTGDVWLTGGFAGKLQFAGGSLNAGNSDQQDMFVVKLDAAGDWRWGRSFGDLGDDEQFNRIELDRDGNPLLFGEIAAGALLAAKLDRIGEVAWSRLWSCEGQCDIAQTAIDGAGQAVLSVMIYPKSTLTLNEQPFTAPDDAYLGVVLKLDRDGLTVWSAAPFPGWVNLAVGPSGEVFVAGDYYEGASFAGGTFNTFAGADDFDIYVARLRP